MKAKIGKFNYAVTSPNISIKVYMVHRMRLALIQGMEWVAAPFIRPLLGASKSDMVEFLQKREQAWREDGSNQVAKCTRNRIRWVI